jgi:hypothetical protein
MRPLLRSCILILAGATFSACDRAARVDAGQDDTVSVMLNSEDPDTALGGPSLSDAHILALFDASSLTDSSVAALAATKGSAAVRDLA